LKNLVSRLDTVYREVGIHPLVFSCEHRDSCVKGCRKFTEAKASFVGHRYGDSVRVVVLSLDPGGREGKHEAKKRTLEAIRIEQGKEQPEGFHKGRHWYRTYETVSALLSRFEDVAEPVCGG
jgi:hypothetical protein